MFQHSHKESSVFRRVISAFTAVFFIATTILPPSVAAQTLPSILNLPAPGVMLAPTVGYTPALIKGIAVNPENPLNFTFYVSQGDENLDATALQATSDKLIKYFLATLTTPSEDLWVNLSPHEKDRIISPKFGVTEMGRDLLAQDYVLKQMTASLMYPEDELGREFWQRVHAKSVEKYGSTQIPTNTFNKIWIVPESAAVYENASGAFVVNSRLKVLMAEDYLAMQEAAGRGEFARTQLGDTDLVEQSAVISEMIREILVPEIEKEVNQGETFANLRQVYNSMILASWFKNNLKETLLGQVYVDRQKIVGVDVDDPQVKEKIYQQYLKAFKLGVYNYIKEEYDPATDKTIPRQYFSGGAGFQRLALMVGDETYTPASIPFARRAVVTGAQSVAEDNSMFAIDVDLWEADGAGVNEAVISEAIDTRVAEIVDLDQERARRTELAVEAEEVLADAAIMAKITDEMTFTWGGYAGDQELTAKESLILDPEAKTITLNRFQQEPVVVQLDQDFVGYERLEGNKLPEAIDEFGNRSWMRTHEFVPGHRQFEVVHEIVLDDADFEKVKGLLRPVGHFPNMVITIIESASSGAFRYRGPNTKITFVSESNADGAQLGEVDMAKFQLNPRWAGDLDAFVGEGKVINGQTNELIAQLTQKYAGTIARLLREREIVQLEVDHGKREHGFLPGDALVEDAYGNTATARQIRESDWTVDNVPEPLTRPGAILTGPWSDPKWAINSLKGGAVRVFNDYEDAGWDKGVAAMVAKQTQMDIVSGAITEYVNPANQKVYTVPDRSEWPVLTTRVRGLHYNSKFFGYDGVTTPAIVEDLTHLIVNNYKQLQEQGSGVNVVIPKTQTPEELKTVAQIISDIEQAVGLPIGTVKIILMNERIEMTLQLEEAIWAARKHVAVTNVGRWDKMASDILARRERGDEIEPNPTAVGMDKPHLAAYVKRNVDISLKRGLEPEGGMVVQMMSRGGSHPETDAWVVEAIRQDKIKEREAKMKFAWVATPQVAGVVNEVFQSGDYSDRQADPYGYTTEEQATLLELPTGRIDKEGVRKAVYDSLAYGIGFRTAGGAVAIVDESRDGLRLMQDLAVLKINYYWLWKLARHEARLDDSEERVTAAYLERVIDEQVAYIKSMSDENPPRADKFADEDWDAVATSIKALVTAPQMVTWESVVMNNVIDETDPKIIEARLRGIFTPRAQLEAELATAIAQKQERKTIRAALDSYDQVHYTPPATAISQEDRVFLEIQDARLNALRNAQDEALIAQFKPADFAHPEFTVSDKALIYQALVLKGLLDEEGVLLTPALMDQREDGRVIAKYLGLEAQMAPYAHYILAVLNKKLLSSIGFLPRTRPYVDLVKDTKAEVLLVEDAKIRAEFAIEAASNLVWDQSMTQPQEDAYRLDGRKSTSEWSADLAIIEAELERREDNALQAESIDKELETVSRQLAYVQFKIRGILEEGVTFSPEWGSLFSLREDETRLIALQELLEADAAIMNEEGTGFKSIGEVLLNVMAQIEAAQLERLRRTVSPELKGVINDAIVILDEQLDDMQYKVLADRVQNWLISAVQKLPLERPALEAEINREIGADVAGDQVMRLANNIARELSKMRNMSYKNSMIAMFASHIVLKWQYPESDTAMLSRKERQERAVAFQEWMDSDRFRLVRDRNWTGEEIAKSRSQSEPLPQVDNRMPRALIELMRQDQAAETYTATGGVMDGPSAVSLAEAGMPALYFSGWQASDHWSEPDLAKYDYNEVPRVMERVNKKLRNADADKWQRFDAIVDELELIFDDLFRALRQEEEIDGAVYTKGFVDAVLKEEPTTEIFIDQFRDDPETILTDVFAAAVAEAVAQKDNTSQEKREAIREAAYAVLADYLVNYLIPFFADGDTGHQSIKEMVRAFVRAGAGGIHIEDQAHGCKKCGHMAGKVLVPTAEQHRRLLEARKEADLLGSELLIIARTDAEAAKLLQSIEDPADHYFLKGVTKKDIPSLASVIRLVRRELRIFKGTSEEAVASLRQRHPTLADGIENIWKLRGEVEGRSLIGENWEVKSTGQDVGSSQDIWASREAIEFEEGVLRLDTIVRSLDGDLELTVQEILDRRPARLKEEMAAVGNLTAEWGKIAGMKTFTQLVEEILTKENKTQLIEVWREWVNPLESTRSVTQMQEKAEELIGHEVYFSEEAARTFEGHYQIEAKAVDTVTDLQYGVLNAAKRSIKMAGIADVIWMEQGTPNVKQGGAFANTVRSDPRGKDILFAINLSPSFNWSNPSAWADQLTTEEIDLINEALTRSEFDWGDPNTWGANDKQLRAVEKMFAAQAAFSEQMGDLGFVFQFVTIFQDHVITHATWAKAQQLRKRGAGGFVHYVQQPEQMAKSRFVKHQTAAGTKRVAREDDPWTRGFSTTGAQGKESTENQFSAKRKDNALTVTEKPETTGGIDLNPELMNLQIKRDGNGVALPLLDQPIDALQNIEGFIPVIMQMTPITTMPLILGLNIDLEPTEFGYQPDLEMDDPRARLEDLDKDQLSFLK